MGETRQGPKFNPKKRKDRETNEIKDQNFHPDCDPGGAETELIKEAIDAFKRLEEVLDRMWESNHHTCVTAYAFLVLPLSAKMRARTEMVMLESKKE